MTMLDTMPCGRTCDICPASLICHADNDPDAPDFDPAEVTYYMEMEPCSPPI